VDSAATVPLLSSKALALWQHSSKGNNAPADQRAATRQS
jgi:hypothetical protein